ncbi:MAG: hypothetical protein GY793_02465 [Proteobacteria bacterium]|nr:hypothetical protein [Pseudomonadota bacterium]
MKKILALLSLVIVSSCAGYTPLYGKLGEEMNKVGLKEVKMREIKRDIGERRIAQILHQKLSRIFSNQFDNDYDLYVELTPTESSIAARSDAIDTRKGISVRAKMLLKNIETGKIVFNVDVYRDSSYTVQDEPFATEAARNKALESIVSALSGDITQRTALWLKGYAKNEDSE